MGILCWVQKKMTIEEAKKTIKGLRKTCAKKADTPKGTIIFYLLSTIIFGALFELSNLSFEYLVPAWFEKNTIDR